MNLQPIRQMVREFEQRQKIASEAPTRESLIRNIIEIDKAYEAIDFAKFTTKEIKDIYKQVIKRYP